MLGKTEDRRRRGCQRIKCLGSIANSIDSLNKLQETVKEREALVSCSTWGLKELDMI